MLHSLSTNRTQTNGHAARIKAHCSCCATVLASHYEGMDQDASTGDMNEVTEHAMSMSAMQKITLSYWSQTASSFPRHDTTPMNCELLALWTVLLLQIQSSLLIAHNVEVQPSGNSRENRTRPPTS